MNYQVRNVTAPDGTSAPLTLYLWDNSVELYDGLLRPLVLLCPGGGYAMTSDREAEGMALRFVAMGVHAAVLRYSVAPARFPTALHQLARSVELIRAHAAEWYVDPERIVVQGSSAGGHLAGSLGVFWNADFLTRDLGTPAEGWKPNGLILSYPVITSGPFAHRGSFQNLLGEREKELSDFVSLEHQVGLPSAMSGAGWQQVISQGLGGGGWSDKHGDNSRALGPVSPRGQDRASREHRVGPAHPG